jgi:hypothetical protein
MEKEKQSQESGAEKSSQVPEYIQSGIKELAGHFGELFESKQESKFLFGKMIQDKEVRVAITALTRALLNIGISAIDVIPGIGEVVSGAADVAKLTEFDLTPDVGKGIAWGSEIFEIITGGAMPTHVFETTIQIIKDMPKIVKGLKKAEKIWIAHKDVVESKKVQNAAAVFTLAPMAA